MTGAASFQIGLGSVGQEFEAEILAGIVFDSWLGGLDGGSYTLRNGDRTLQVDIVSRHLTYKLDLNQDGVFEIQSMLDDPEY